MKPLLLIVIIPTLLLSFHDYKENKIKNNPITLEKTLDNVETKLKVVYDKLNLSSKYIDEFLTHQYDESIYTDSYIRFETSLEKKESNYFKIKPNINIRLKLPKLKKKLSITFDNNDNRINPNYQDSNEKLNFKDDNYNIGILYNTKKQDVKLKFRLGAKISSNPYLYAKAEANKTFELNKSNNIILEQKIRYSDKYELDNYSSLRYNYKINNKFLISNYNEYYVNSRIKNDNLYNSLRLNHNLSKKSYINYVTAIDSNDDDSNFKIKRYKTYVSYRSYIRKWLYYDVIPNIEWEIKEDFDRSIGIKINLGVKIGK